MRRREGLGLAFGLWHSRGGIWVGEGREASLHKSFTSSITLNPFIFFYFLFYFGLPVEHALRWFQAFEAGTFEPVIFLHPTITQKKKTQPVLFLLFLHSSLSVSARSCRRYDQGGAGRIQGTCLKQSATRSLHCFLFCFFSFQTLNSRRAHQSQPRD